ncbi:MAG: TolB family protein [Chitinophagales bacterium]
MTKYRLLVPGILLLSIPLLTVPGFYDHINPGTFSSDPVYQIAFANFGPLNEDIFIADADGTHSRPLLPDPANDYNASFSHDGKWIVFTSERNGSADIYRVHPDGSGLEQLTNDPSFDDQAAFSPDGKKIAFVSSRNKQADIYVLEIATKKITNITNHPAGDFRPSWSPDGEWIAFSTDRDSKRPMPVFTLWHSTEIYTTRVDGSDTKKRTKLDAYAGCPDWSPDGKQIVFYEAALQQVRNMNTVMKTNTTTQLSVLNLADNTKQTITKDSVEKIYPRWFADGSLAYVVWGEKPGIVFTNGRPKLIGNFESPSWSPDGGKMVFHREVNSGWPPFYKLYSRDKQFQLIRSGVFPCYSPSGKNLICNDKTAGIHHNQIMEMNADGTHRFILFGDSIKSALAPVWSPQGDKIAFGFGRFFQSLQGPAIGDIAIINSDGTHLEVLTDGKGNYGFPSWSPDGKKIVYRGTTDGVTGLYIIELGTKKITRLTTNSHDNFPGWSPNGDLIAFTGRREGNYDIYTIRPDGSDLKRLTTDPGNEAHSVWSPDGKWIAFSSGRIGFKDESALHPYNPQPYGEICVMHADGSDVRVLTDNQYEEATPAWMPLKKSK